ncbi:MAG: sigma 54-interacting transcriptional regulator [Oscillospiraceae bacterium]|nr:sigma 54-interacting transcriptional regulator [Oscillospiraceae bacterium]
MADSGMREQMELLCGVLDALPYPTALLDTELMPAYVNDGKCPIPFEDVDFAALSEARTALGGAAQSARRTRLTAGAASCFGVLELYPVRVGEDGRQVAGVLAMFRPEFSASEMSADAVPTRSAAMDAVWTRLQRYALLASPVLFLGEEGTGKTDFARALHRMSARRDKPFVVLEPPRDDAALPSAVRDSEDGTLLCLRLEAWPPEHQRRLLELLDSKSVTAPGGQTVYKQCRVTAAALPDGELLPALMEWFGLMAVRLPPLRERREDILPAAREFLGRLALREDKDIQGFSADAQEILRHYAWPGNLRELREVAQAAVGACPGGLVLASHLPVGGKTGVTLSKGGLQAMRTAYTREQITSLLAVYGGTVEAKRRAAKELGIGLSTLYRILAKE